MIKPTLKQRKLGWDYNYQFLQRIAEKASMEDEFVTMETVNAVMKVLENELNFKFEDLE